MICSIVALPASFRGLSRIISASSAEYFHVNNVQVIEDYIDLLVKGMGHGYKIRYVRVVRNIWNLILVRLVRRQERRELEVAHTHFDGLGKRLSGSSPAKSLL